MTSAGPQTDSSTTHASRTNTIAPATTTSPSSGVVPAPLPRSNASALKTASSNTALPAGASLQNAQPVSTPVNGVNMAQGGPQSGPVPNGTPSSGEHGRKASVTIGPTGASGYPPNGGPVNNGRAPNISFGSINQSSPLPAASVPHHSSSSSLTTPQANPRTTTPTHSPSPIPQPPASGGRPPSSLQQSTNGMQFGSMGGDSADQMRQGQMPPLGPGGMPMHERRTSSQSMHSANFAPSNGRGGRGGYPGAQPYMSSPGPNNFRASTGQPPRPPNMQQFAGGPPGSPFQRGRNSPALAPQQPNMPPQHMGGNPQMGYGYQNMPPQGYQQQGMYQPYDPNGGYYQPYWGGYPPQPQPSPGPRGYPSPFQPPQGPMQPPFHPAHHTSMSRSGSQASERPSSGMGQPSTPSMPHAPPPSQTPVSGQSAQPAQGNQFVRPAKTSKAILIKDPNSGNALNYNKSSPVPSATTAPPEKREGPVIVSTPGVVSTSTPPPRVPSSQHNRTESKSTKTAEETKREFQESVKRRMGNANNGEAEAVKAEPEKPVEAQTTQAKAEPEEASKDVVKEATAEAEKAAAVAAGDKAGEDAADAALAATEKADGEKTEQEETEEERMEREIAEMEAKEAEEEERERAYQEKRAKEKEANAAKEAEKQKKQDEELKRQEREAEEREEQKERERQEANDKAGDDTDDQAKDMFAQLKKPTLGPAASAGDSGTQTPASEDADSSSMPPPTQPASGSLARPGGAAMAGKPKPAHLKLETTKRVEPAEPTPGMQALKSARFLTIKEEAKYPDGFKSPNPALNVNGTRKGRAYDKDFLLQFQSVFKEKPSVDWDQKVRETLGPGDEPGSARPGSARTPSSNMGRSASGRPQQPMQNFGGAMGQFGGIPGRTLQPGTTSEQRFAASQQGGRPGMGAMPGQMGGRGPSFGMPQPVGMSRTNSLQAMGNLGAPGSPRQPSARGRGGNSRRGDRTMSKKEEAELAAKMPLTAGGPVKELDKTGSGWKASSLAGPTQSEHDINGNMTPELVQRKVKAALNKMTPDNFDKISNQILEIAAQSKNETDGRTLRQVIQLTFEKATDESHWAGMYAQFCFKMLTAMSPEIRDETIKDKNGQPVVGGALFRKYLLNRCQEDFEQGWQANLPQMPDGSTGQDVKLLSDEYYAAAAAKRRGLGLIQFIGQLYILRMLTLRIMHECVMRLLNFEGEPDEAAVENLTTLLRAVGGTMEDEEKGNEFMNMYFDRINNAILKNEALPSRPRFMIMDLVDLRKAGWKGKNDNKGPKTIAQVHQEADAAAAKAEAERQRTAQRGGPGGRPPAGRGDARQFSGGGPLPPVDHNRNQVGLDDLRRLQNRGANRPGAGNLGPGGSLGPASMLGARSGSRRGAGNLGPSSSGNTTRTNTPPVGEKKEEPTSQNAFGALAALDPSGEAHDDAVSEAASPPTRAKSPLAATEKVDETST